MLRHVQSAPFRLQKLGQTCCLFASRNFTIVVHHPSAHRSQKHESLPLKRGMLRYAHTRQLPVQVRGQGLGLAMQGKQNSPSSGCPPSDGAQLFETPQTGCSQQSNSLQATRAACSCRPLMFHRKLPPPHFSPSGLTPHATAGAPICLQVVITAGKEQVLNERRRSMHFGRTLVTGCSGGRRGPAMEATEAARMRTGWLAESAAIITVCPQTAES